MTNHILWPNEIKKEDLAKVGGKALRLAKLVQAGFNVPRAFCLTSAFYQEFLEYNKLEPQLRLLRLDRNKTVLKKICQRISEQILRGKIPIKTREEVAQGIKKINVSRFAIRSSASCEDLYLASFAGQFETYLDVWADQVFDAIRKCWASIFSGRVLTYTLFHNIELATVNMAVLIQEMIEAEKGGVLFTKNVLDSTRPYAIVIEASAGTADDVVSGLVEPERIIVDKKTQVEISHSAPNGNILTAKEIKTLVDLAMKIEDFFQGVPQDIEWVIGRKQVYLLQSRPITA